MSNVRVFKSDGTLQCGMGAEVTLDEMREDLAAIVGEVVSSEKRVLPFMFPTVCGAPTGRVNTYEITSEQYAILTRGFSGPMGFARWIFDTPTVEVFKYDGTLQCGMGNEVVLGAMEKELEDGGIRVHSRRKDTDGLVHIALCGALTGQVNVFEIDSARFEAARNLGFQYFLERQRVAVEMTGVPAEDATIRSTAADGDVDPWPW